MARNRPTEIIYAKIAKNMAVMSKLQDQYDKLAEKLNNLQELKRRLEADVIMDAYLKRGRQESRRNHIVFSEFDDVINNGVGCINGFGVCKLVKTDDLTLCL